MVKKYVIWDKTKPIITPSNQVFTAEQWLARYPWVAIDGVKAIVGGGLFNGCVMMEFNTTVEAYRKYGVNFSACVTDQDYLDAISDFEDNPPTPEPTADERIASALEFQNLLNMPDTI